MVAAFIAGINPVPGNDYTELYCLPGKSASRANQPPNHAGVIPSEIIPA